MLVEAIRAIPGLSSDSPPGSFYVFADCGGLIGAVCADGRVLASDLDVAEYLVSTAHVGMVPGTAFGTPGYLRIAYAIDDALLAEALVRIADAVGHLVLPGAPRSAEQVV